MAHGQLVDLGDGAVGLRALSNGMYLKVVPPSDGSEFGSPWKTQVVSPLPGLAERFRVSGAHIYSELMHGYLQCSGDKLAEPVVGYPGETLYESSDMYEFNFTKATPSQISYARTLRDASK